MSKAGFNAYPSSSGVRAAWRCCNLNNGGNAGLAAANSNNGVTNANWNGAAGAQLVKKKSSSLHFAFRAYVRKLFETSSRATGFPDPACMGKSLCRRLVAQAERPTPNAVEITR